MYILYPEKSYLHIVLKNIFRFYVRRRRDNINLFVNKWSELLFHWISQIFRSRICIIDSIRNATFSICIGDGNVATTRADGKVKVKLERIDFPLSTFSSRVYVYQFYYCVNNVGNVNSFRRWRNGFLSNRAGEAYSWLKHQTWRYSNFTVLGLNSQLPFWAQLIRGVTICMCPVTHF